MISWLFTIFLVVEYISYVCHKHNTNVMLDTILQKINENNRNVVPFNFH